MADRTVAIDLLGMVANTRDQAQIDLIYEAMDAAGIPSAGGRIVIDTPEQAERVQRELRARGLIK